MQKIIKNAVSARREAANKIKRAKKFNEANRVRQIKREEREWKQRDALFNRNAMKQMEEDWNLGPLAPRRESGVDVKRYGYGDYLSMHPRRVLPQVHKTLEAQRERRFMRSRFVAGDRVVIIRGLDQGRIGVIDSIHYEEWSVKIRGLRQVRLLFV
jgi:large subunit ribosomal protein L24